jgi:hypothetical protein
MVTESMPHDQGVILYVARADECDRYCLWATLVGM